MLQLADSNIALTKEHELDARQIAFDILESSLSEHGLRLKDKLTGHAKQIEDEMAEYAKQTKEGLAEHAKQTIDVMTEHANSVKEELTSLSRLANNHREIIQNILISLRKRIDERDQHFTSSLRLFLEVRNIRALYYLLKLF